MKYSWITPKKNISCRAERGLRGGTEGTEGTTATDLQGKGTALGNEQQGEETWEIYGNLGFEMNIKNLM